MNDENNEHAPGLREAIIGFDNDANVLFYYAEDVKKFADDEFDFELDSRSAQDPAFPGEPTPLLALKPGGSGLWFDKPGEWVMAGARPNGWVAFTAEDVELLRDMAEVGDLLIPLSKQTGVPGQTSRQSHSHFGLGENNERL